MLSKIHNYLETIKLLNASHIDLGAAKNINSLICSPRRYISFPARTPRAGRIAAVGASTCLEYMSWSLISEVATWMTDKTAIPSGIRQATIFIYFIRTDI